MEQNQRDILAQTRTHLASERTLLAAERTFSAWIRTGLAGMGGGFAIIRLISFQSFLHKMIADFIGEFLILWGMGVFIFALFRYLKSVKRLEVTVGHSISIWGTIVVACSLVFISMLLMFIAI
jgi:putative membrane protein